MTEPPHSARLARATIQEAFNLTARVFNAERYRANAQAYAQRLDELVAEVEAELAPVRDKPVVVFHDASSISSSASASTWWARSPSARR